VLAAVSIGLTAAPAWTASNRSTPGRTAPARAGSAANVPVREPEPEPGPSAATVPPTPTPPPAAVKVNVGDLAVSPSYWQGTATRYDLRITVTNTGEPALTTSTDLTLPTGLNKVSASAPDCTISGLTFGCPLSRGAATTIVVTVTVAADAWRGQQAGTARTTAKSLAGDSSASSEDPFAVVFPPGPPTRGIDLAATDLVLPPGGGRLQDTAQLEVRLRNTGAVQALGLLEIVTPANVQVATMPAQCTNRERLSVSRERCTLGPIAAGQQVVLQFGLSVRAQARAEAPLHGNVLGSLQPAGQDAVLVQAAYQIVVATGRAASPGASNGPELDAPAADQADQDQGAARPGRTVARSVSRPMSVIPLLSALVGLFTVLGIMVILSLRRRMHDESAPPGVRV
jgi:hypothetical protein